MKYDDGSWHYESTTEGPEEARWEAACAHLGVYLKWCILKGWIGELHTSDDYSREALEAVKSGKMSATQFVIEQCDCQLNDEDLNEEGNRFTAYYMEAGFIDDLSSVAADQLMSAPESEYDYQALSGLFDHRHSEWVSSGYPAKPPSKPWWKFW